MNPRLGPAVAHAILRHALCGLKYVVSASALRQAPTPHHAVTPCAGSSVPWPQPCTFLETGRSGSGQCTGLGH